MIGESAPTLQPVFMADVARQLGVLGQRIDQLEQARVTRSEAWTPTVTGFAASAIDGRFTRIGRVVHYRLIATASGAGTGAFDFTLPVASSAVLYPDLFPIGTALAWDVSAALIWFGQTAIRSAGTKAAMFYPVNATGGNAAAGAGAPFVWATGDRLWMSGTYESA